MKFTMKKNKSRKLRNNTHVEAWWAVAVVISVVVNVSIVGVCLYVFREVDRGEFFVSQKNERSLEQVVDPEEVHVAVEMMEARKGNIEELKQKAPSLIDPSR